MDFSSLLGLAQEKQSNKVDIKRYSTKVTGPKKLNPKEKKLSENVRRFMEKKEDEERKKRLDAADRTKALLAKRSEDKKSMKTMKSMLLRTKSANKAVVPVDNNNTAATLAGRNQCDEDDYGYESGFANNYYDKLMKKYEATQVDPMEKYNRIMKTPKELRSTLNRVKSALEEQEEPHVRKKRSSKRAGDPSPPRPSPVESCNTSSSSTNKTRKEKELEARKIRLKNASKMPPSTSFHDLIKMAQAKASGQPISDPLSKTKSSAAKDFEFHRPMTNKMKEEFKREYLSKMRKAGKLPMAAKKETPESNAKSVHPPVSSLKKSNGASESSLSSSSKSSSVDKSKKDVETRKTVPKEPVKRDVNSVKAREFIGEKRIRPPTPPPTTSVRKSAPFNPKMKPQKRNRIESESEEEYDSEMDDFIDDTDTALDISAQIRGIFGYDRRKYADEADFDDRSMVANYSTIMKEEVRSAKIGKMEDLEDMKREEEELQRKMARKKKRY
ncbi:uncharacterized protein [Lepeophtheirus salmonis]|uniref:uncharacterized protein n=1 Tax=Lepeophtheirus salmonis TaxID=72036 RepID=UPI001AEB9711|nr:protein SPT2 homolog [Lepeophtheirus salmonis]